MDYRQKFNEDENFKMYEDYSAEENTFVVSHEGNAARHYEIKSPIQFTLACCSGTGKDDYVNFYSISTKKSFYYRRDYKMQSDMYRGNPLHYHDYFELALVLEGNVIQNIESKEYMYHAGSLCLIGRNLHHAEQFLSKGSVLFVGISEPLMKELLNESNLFFQCENQNILSSSLYQFVHTDLITSGSKAYLDFIPTTQNLHSGTFLRSFCEKLINSFFSPDFGATYEIKGLLCRLLARLCDNACYHCRPIALDLDTDYLLFSRIESLLKECDGHIARRELADNLHYTGDYLNRIVKKYTNMSLHDYSMSFCMKKAADLLQTTAKSISAIALELHFSNRTYFYRLFQETYGMTPKEFRQNAVLNIK